MKKEYIIIIISCLFLDQITKWWCYKFLNAGQVIEIFPILNFRLAWNYGISFSMFTTSSELGRLSLILLSLLVIGFLILYAYKSKYQFERFCVTVVVGGALGNVLDRFTYGAVVDFIDFHIGNWHYPTFNLADCFIVCGVITMILYGLIKDYQAKKLR